MACPTCDHTMTAIDAGLYWCPRCGTVNDSARDADHPDEVSVPHLVGRCREFADAIRLSSLRTCEWRQLGIEESINPPEKRNGGE